MRDADDRRRSLADGAEAESLVARALEARGWEVLARNWRGGGGELDLVVHHDGRLRMVEVKARRRDDPVGLEAIDGRKQRRLRGAARAWLQGYDDLIEEVCFLVALVTLDGREDPAAAPTIEWIDDAFDG